jgi:hypothetical protein
MVFVVVGVCLPGGQLLRKLMTPLAMQLNSEAEASCNSVTDLPAVSLSGICQ